MILATLLLYFHINYLYFEQLILYELYAVHTERHVQKNKTMATGYKPTKSKGYAFNGIILKWLGFSKIWFIYVSKGIWRTIFYFLHLNLINSFSYEYPVTARAYLLKLDDNR